MFCLRYAPAINKVNLFVRQSSAAAWAACCYGFSFYPKTYKVVLLVISFWGFRVFPFILATNYSCFEYFRPNS